METSRLVGLWTDYNCFDQKVYVCKLPRQGYTQPTLPTTTTTPIPCPFRWTEADGYCYKGYHRYRNKKKSWFESLEFCRNLGGDLASFHNTSTHRIVLARIPRYSWHRSVWIGLRNTPLRAVGSAHVWSDNTPFDFANWDVGQPDNHNGHELCVAIAIQTSKWRDKNCAVAQSWICQIKKGVKLLTTPPTKSTTPTPHCGDDNWLLHNESCYYITPNYGTNSKFSWFGARSWCRQNGGDLASIHDIDENNFITTQIGKLSSNKFWIGLNELSLQGYTWSDGTSTNFINWAINEPNDFNGGQRCVDIYHDRGVWNDENCGDTLSYVCKRPKGGYTPKTDPATTLSPGYCPAGFKGIVLDNKCFKLFGLDESSRLNWTASLDACQSLGRGFDLASITSLQDQVYLTSLLQNIDSPLWVGLNNRMSRNQFHWTDNQPVDFTHWDDAEPYSSYRNNVGRNCGEIRPNAFNAGSWGVAICSTEKAYICETWRDSSITTSSPTESNNCRTGFTKYGDSCYLLDKNSSDTWTNARQFCQDHDADLVSITDKFEQTFVQLMAMEADMHVWTGMSSSKDTHNFIWSNGWPVTYTRWANNKPSQVDGKRCVTLQQPSGYWNDTSCEINLPAVCEISNGTPPPHTSPAPGFCLIGWYPYEGHCYYIDTSTRHSWGAAVRKCNYKSNGVATLTSIHSKGELDFLVGLVAQQRANSAVVWIGLVSQAAGSDGGFYWLDNSPVNYQNWAPTMREANYYGNRRNCVQMRNGVWNMFYCEWQNAGCVCKMDKIVLTTQPVVPEYTCASDWSEVDNYCYKGYNLLNEELSWAEAREFCVKLGGNLASFHNASIQEQVYEKEMRVASHDHFWIGLSYQAGNDTGMYAWSDTTEFDYTHWDVGQPDNHNGQELCVQLSTKTKRWSDKNCAVTQNWICQIESGRPLQTSTEGPTTTASSTCGGSDWASYNGSCYYMSPGYVTSSTKLSWFRAREWCIRNGGELASIHTIEENSWLTTQLGKRTQQIKIWIGLNELGLEGYEWSDGTPLNLRNWKKDEPNDFNGGQRCVDMYVSSGAWNDDNCGDIFGFVCKRPEGDTKTRTIPATTSWPGYCLNGWTAMGNKCFKVFGDTESERKNWTNALDACRSLGSGYELASISDMQEQVLVTTLVYNKDYTVWTGLNDNIVHNEFRWVDNQPVEFTYWDKGEPNGRFIPDDRKSDNQDCVELRPYAQDAARWGDANCTVKNGYLCETWRDPSIRTPLTPPASNCPEGYQSFGSSCYRIDLSSSTWELARAACSENDGDLASITNSFEQAFIQKLGIDLGKTVWIGMSSKDNGREYQWSDGWPVLYTKWAENEPSQDNEVGCVALNYTNGQWNDTICNQKLPFVCEINLGTPPPYPTPGPGYCPVDWHSFSGYCYYFEGKMSKSWGSANLDCTFKQKVATLASIHSDDETNFILNAVHNLNTNHGGFWLGMLRTPGEESGFYWVDSSPVSYNNWDDKQPDGLETSDNCVELKFNGKWDDLHCNLGKGSICKMPRIGSSIFTPYKITGGDTADNTGLILGIILGIIGLAVVVALLVILYRKRGSKLSFVSFGSAAYNHSNDQINVSTQDSNDVEVSMTTLHSGLLGD